MRARQSRLPIRKAFKRNLIFFVLLPVLIVFAVFVISLYYGFHARAINNIELVHESLSGMLTGEVSDTSMLLASVMYTNNSVIIDYAEACDTDDLTAPTGKPVGFWWIGLHHVRTPFSGFGTRAAAQST